MYYTSQALQYISDELFHFVGRHEKNEEHQFALLVKILNSGTLLSSKYSEPSTDVGAGARLTYGELSRVPAICFCDIPRPLLNIHMAKYLIEETFSYQVVSDAPFLFEVYV